MVENDLMPVERTIHELREGESGYTVPWAVRQYACGTMTYNKNFELIDEPGGTATLKVTKASTQVGGNVIDIILGSYKGISHDSKPFPGYASGSFKRDEDRGGVSEDELIILSSLPQAKELAQL